jgi:transposase InsO family protein
MRRRELPGPRAEQDAVLADAIVAANSVARGTYGTPRLRTALKHQGIRTSRRRIARIRRALGLQVRKRKRFINTTQSTHDSPIAENLLDRQFYPGAPNKVWVTDITYLRSANHWLYLCTIVDCFSGRVVGRQLSNAIDAQLVCDTLRMAVRNRRPATGCMVHSDRGSQYASNDFRALLSKHELTQSMSRRANCWDNAVAESAFGRLKSDIGEEFESDAHTVQTVYEYLDIFYNHTRIHTRFDQTPAEFEAQFKRQNSANIS